MAVLQELNLSPNIKPTNRNPIISRRQSLVKGIDQQVRICERTMEGENVVRDELTNRKLPSWFWMDESGDFYLSINYGKSPLELSKGKFSVLCKDIEDVKHSLFLVRQEVLNGTFDVVLEKKSNLIRKNFGRN